MLKIARAALRRANQRTRNRRQYGRLRDLDDHLLRDIGLARDEIESRLADPLL